MNTNAVWEKIYLSFYFFCVWMEGCEETLVYRLRAILLYIIEQEVYSHILKCERLIYFPSVAFSVFVSDGILYLILCDLLILLPLDIKKFLHWAREPCQNRMGHHKWRDSTLKKVHSIFWRGRHYSFEEENEYSTLKWSFGSIQIQEGQIE